MAEELCNAWYLAQQVAGSVVIIAFGRHSTSGYEVHFRDTPIAVFPPEHRLVHIAPDGPTAQVETDFVVHTSFPASEPVKSVVVHDASGRHEIKVEQTPELIPTCSPDKGTLGQAE